MKIILQGSEMDLTPSLKTYVESKFEPMARLIKRFDEEGAVEVRVEIGRTTKHHRHGYVYRAEVNLRLEGSLLRAEEEDKDVRAAVDKIKDKLRLEIDKFKTRSSPRRTKTRLDK